jgi:hypothetical protein
MCSDAAALDNPSFETKQKILRLVVERVEFVEDQITIKHVIPISDVRLQRDQHNDTTPSRIHLKTTCASLNSNEHQESCRVVKAWLLT